MNQKSIYFGVLVAVATLSLQALAQANKFEEFSLAAGFNIGNSNFARRAHTVPSFPAANGTSVNAALQAEYGYAINEKYLLSVGATRALGPLYFGT